MHARCSLLALSFLLACPCFYPPDALAPMRLCPRRSLAFSPRARSLCATGRGACFCPLRSLAALYLCPHSLTSALRAHSLLCASARRACLCLLRSPLCVSARALALPLPSLRATLSLFPLRLPLPYALASLRLCPECALAALRKFVALPAILFSLRTRPFEPLPAACAFLCLLNCTRSPLRISASRSVSQPVTLDRLFLSALYRSETQGENPVPH